MQYFYDDCTLPRNTNCQLNLFNKDFANDCLNNVFDSEFKSKWLKSEGNQGEQGVISLGRIQQSFSSQWNRTT
jgi:hypothetical protein